MLRIFTACLESEESCTTTTVESSNEKCDKLAHSLAAFTYDVGLKECVTFQFDGCSRSNVFLDLEACSKGSIFG